MGKISLEAKVLTIDGEQRIALERAKKNAAINRNSTCFAGQGAVTKSQVIDSMRLAEKKKRKNFV